MVTCREWLKDTFPYRFWMESSATVSGIFKVFARAAEGSASSTNMTNPTTGRYNTVDIRRSPLPNNKNSKQQHCYKRIQRWQNLPILRVFIGLIDISVENRKTDEECKTDKVFKPLYIMIIINQREKFLNLTDRCKKIFHVSRSRNG